jgi:hypothetical protein
MVEILTTHYASDDWNPLNVMGDIDSFPKGIAYCIMVGLLCALQLLHIVLYMIFSIIMFLRIPVVLFLMIFLSSTKLIFFKRSWNKLIYLWTLDETKLIPIGESHVDLEMLHMVKEQELVLEVGFQFILQLVNAALRDELSDVYLLSVAACAFDLLSCVYRYAYFYYKKDRDLQEVKAYEIKDLNIHLTSHELKWHDNKNNKKTKINDNDSDDNIHSSSVFGFLVKSFSQVLEFMYETIQDPVGVCLKSVIDLRVEERTRHIIDDIVEIARENGVDEQTLDIIKKYPHFDDDENILLEIEEESTILELVEQRLTERQIHQPPL